MMPTPHHRPLTWRTKMLRQAGLFFSIAATALACVSPASSAAFNVAQSATGTAATAIVRHGDSRESLYRSVSIDRDGQFRFPEFELEFARSEYPLKWALGRAEFAGPPAASLPADTALHLLGANRPLLQNPERGQRKLASKEGTAPETWAVVLIGAGLAWLQLRRKSRQTAIRFSAR
jgi:hypothetical protein